VSDCPAPTPQPETNGEWKSNLAAVVLLGLATYLLIVGLVPKEAMYVATPVSLYLFLPRRMRTLGDWLLSIYQTVRGKK
jgi:hypothetical protein